MLVYSDAAAELFPLKMPFVVLDAICCAMQKPSKALIQEMHGRCNKGNACIDKYLENAVAYCQYFFILMLKITVKHR